MEVKAIYNMGEIPSPYLEASDLILDIEREFYIQYTGGLI